MENKKKDNFKQALNELFGIGEAEAAAPAKASSGKAEEKAASAAVKAAPEKKPEKAPVPVPEKKPEAKESFLAPGTVFEGTLRSEGDIEIAGMFKGDVTTTGTVMLRSNIQGNLNVGSLRIVDCALTGDVTAKGTVFINEGAKIYGNVTAAELMCSGEITGDLKISGNTQLEEKSKIAGSVVTGTLAVARGAVIKGGIQMKLEETSAEGAN